MEKTMKKGKAVQRRTLKDVCDEYVANPTSENFGKVFLRLRYGLYKKAFGILRSNKLTDEAVMRTFEKMVKNVKTYSKRKGEFSTWVYKICINEALEMLTSQKNISCVDNDISNIHQTVIGCSGASDFIEEDDISGFIGLDQNGLFAVNSMDKEHAFNELFNASLYEMDQLSDKKMGICLREKYLNGMHIDEISEKYGYPNVRNIIYNGKIKMNHILNHKYPQLCRVLYEKPKIRPWHNVN